MNNKVSVILLNYNSWKDTVECIDSLLQSSYENFNIIVVDNCSSDDSIEKISQYLKMGRLSLENHNYNFKDKYTILNYDGSNFSIEEIKNESRVYFIKNSSNGGFSKGNNIGLKFCESKLNSKYYWILNNDTIVDRYAIENLVLFSESNNNDGFIGATILEYYNPKTIQCTCGAKYYKAFTISKNCNEGKSIDEIDSLTESSNFISGCSIFGHKSLFLKVNNLSEDYFLYFEELDLMQKANRHNIKKKWAKNVYVYHKEGASIGSENIQHKKSLLSEYYSNYSCLTYNHKFYKKSYKLYAFNRFILKSIKFILCKNFEHLKIMKKAYKDFFAKVE